MQTERTASVLEWYDRHSAYKGVGRKIFRGRTMEKIPKNSKKISKNSTLSLFQEGRGKRKKDRKIANKDRKIVLLSLYLLYHV